MCACSYFRISWLCLFDLDDAVLLVNPKRLTHDLVVTTRMNIKDRAI